MSTSSHQRWEWALGVLWRGFSTARPQVAQGTNSDSVVDWSCGCQTRPVFTMAYRPTSPLELRLCKDVGADTCEAHCSSTLTFDLSYALQDAGATEFVFAD